MPMPTAVAIQWVEATTPKVPSISGRVVKKLGLMLLIEVPRRKGRHFTTGRPGGQPPASAQVPAAHRVGAPTVGVNWRASGRARTIGRRLCVVRLAGGLIAEHRAPSLDLARRLAHLGAQSLFREIAVPGAALVKLAQMLAPPLRKRVPLARKLVGPPGRRFGIVHDRAAAAPPDLAGVIVERTILTHNA